jgi:dihydropteroate synthase
MQQNPQYKDVVSEIMDYFVERIGYAEQSGIGREKIIIDPGIGFGKSVNHNITIMRNLAQFSRLRVPLLIGLSRKSFLGHLSGEKEPLKREAETLTANVLAAIRGASILRVHRVDWAVKSIKTLRELLPLAD